MRRIGRSAVWHALAITVAFAAAGSAAESSGVAGSGVSQDQIVLATPAYEPQETYGTAPTVYTVRIEDFAPPASTVPYSNVNTGGVYVFPTAASSDWWGKIYLPSGAIVDRLEMQACDTTATGQVLFGIARMDAPAQTGANVTPVGSTGQAATPGCAFFSVTPSGALAIDNMNKSYVIFVAWTGNFTSANKVAAFRVYYRLQISPAPATATFPNDVPTTHPFFRFVEAMAASGLTGGCAAGSFCPNNPVTRGQMSVFLATALGLHFPN